METTSFLNTLIVTSVALHKQQGKIMSHGLLFLCARLWFTLNSAASPTP